MSETKKGKCSIIWTNSITFLDMLRVHLNKLKIACYDSISLETSYYTCFYTDAVMSQAFIEDSARKERILSCVVNDILKLSMLNVVIILAHYNTENLEDNLSSLLQVYLEKYYDVKSYLIEFTLKAVADLIIHGMENRILHPFPLTIRESMGICREVYGPEKYGIGMAASDIKFVILKFNALFSNDDEVNRISEAATNGLSPHSKYSTVTEGVEKSVCKGIVISDASEVYDIEEFSGVFGMDIY